MSESKGELSDREFQQKTKPLVEQADGQSSAEVVQDQEDTAETTRVHVIREALNDEASDTRLEVSKREIASEQSSSDKRRLLERIADAYFEPKKFERNPKFYERLGVKFFKKYMPTSGDFVRRRRGAEPLITDSSSLKKWEETTKQIEGLHLRFAGVMTGMTAGLVLLGKPEIAGFAGGLNVLLNGYPIMLQRYNRARIYNVLERLKAVKNKHTESDSTISSPRSKIQ